MEYAFSDQRWLTADEIKLKKKSLEKNGLGFHKSGMWDKVVDIEKCHLQDDPATIFETQLRNLHWIIIWYFLTLGKNQDF